MIMKMFLMTMIVMTTMKILIRRLSQLLSITNPHTHDSYYDDIIKTFFHNEFDENYMKDGGFISFTGLTRFNRIISVTSLHVL